MDTVTLPLDHITPEAQLQPRVEGIDPEHVKELEGVAEHWPPLKVVRLGQRYVLVDGFHRFAAAQNLKLGAVTAIVMEVPEGEDLHALAFALNAAHGRPLTLSDRRAFAARLLRQHPDLSDREIGRRCGLVQPTIAKVRQELEQRADIPPTETRVGRDGRTYVVSQPAGAGNPSLASVLAEVITNIFTPAERRSQRQLVRYLEQVVDLLAQQDALSGFEKFEQVAEACRVVLGTVAATELGGRLGGPSANIIEIARDLGYREERR